MPILRIPDENGDYISIPAIEGAPGSKGDKGDTGPKGATGPKGDTGTPGLVVSESEPEDKDIIWVDPTSEPDLDLNRVPVVIPTARGEDRGGNWSPTFYMKEPNIPGMPEVDDAISGDIVFDKGNGDLFLMVYDVNNFNSDYTRWVPLNTVSSRLLSFDSGWRTAESLLQNGFTEGGNVPSRIKRVGNTVHFSAQLKAPSGKKTSDVTTFLRLPTGFRVGTVGPFGSTFVERLSAAPNTLVGVVNNNGSSYLNIRFVNGSTNQTINSEADIFVTCSFQTTDTWNDDLPGERLL